jgi:hypothetical protein
MLYKKTLLLLPENDYDKLYDIFREYIVKELVSDNTYQQEQKLKTALKEFEIVLTPLENELSDKTDTSFKLNKAIAPLANSAENALEEPNLEIRNYELLNEYLNSLLVYSFVKEENLKAILKKEAETLYSYVLGRLETTPSNESQAIIKSSFEKSAKNFYEYFYNRTSDNELENITNKINTINETYQKNKARIENELEILTKKQNDRAFSELIRIYYAGDNNTRTAVASMLGKNLPDENGPTNDYLKGIAFINSHKNLPFSIGELEIAIEKNDAEKIEELNKLLEKQQQLFSQQIPIITEIVNLLKKFDIPNYSYDHEELLFPYLLEVEKVRANLNYKVSQYAKDTIEPFTIKEALYGHVLGILLDSASQQGAGITKNDAVNIALYYFGETHEDLSSNYNSFLAKTENLEKAKKQDPIFIVRNIREDLKQSNFQQILFHIAMALRIKQIRFSEVEDKNYKGQTYNDFAGLIEADSWINEENAISKKERKILNDAYAKFEEMIKNRENLSETQVDEISQNVANTIQQSVERIYASYLENQLKESFQWYKERNRDRPEEEIQEIISDERKNWTISDVPKHVICKIAEELTRDIDHTSPNSKINPYMQVQINLRQGKFEK